MKLIKESLIRVSDKAMNLTTEEKELKEKLRRREHQRDILTGQSESTKLDKDFLALIEEIETNIRDIDVQLKDVQEKIAKKEKEQKKLSNELVKKENELEEQKKSVKAKNEEISTLNQTLQWERKLFNDQLQVAKEYGEERTVSDQDNKHYFNHEAYYHVLFINVVSYIAIPVIFLTAHRCKLFSLDNSCQKLNIAFQMIKNFINGK